MTTTIYDLVVTPRSGRSPYRPVQPGIGPALFEAYARAPIPGSIGERLRAEYEQVFPPCMGEGR
jgi:hypothetical protein